MDALAQTAPNARDYYVQGPDAMREAVEQHEIRQLRLDTVRAELEELYQAIEEQGK